MSWEVLGRVWGARAAGKGPQCIWKKPADARFRLVMHVQIMCGYKPVCNAAAAAAAFTQPGNKTFCSSSSTKVGFCLAVTVFSALCSTLPLTCQLTAQSRRGNIQGTWTSHLFTSCLTRAWPVGELTTDWLWFVHQNTIGYDLQTGLGETKGALVWNPTETRDYWMRAFKDIEQA